MGVDWIPIVMFTGMTIVLSLLVWFRFRIKREMQETMRTAIEQGQQLSAEIVDRLGQPKPPPDRDFRLSLIWLAIAISLTVFGFVIPDDSGDARGVFFGIAAFPLCLGIAYFIMWRVTGQNQ